MSRQHCYVLVEGQQDVLFVGRLLQTLGVPAVKDVDEISPVWTSLVDSSRLTEHRGLLAAGRQGLQIHVLFNGVCFQSERHSVVVQKAGGNGPQFRRRVQEMNVLLDGGLKALRAVGLISDSDRDPLGVRQSSEQVFRDVQLSVPVSPATVAFGSPNIGIYSLPLPMEQGAVEDLMMDCAKVVYPTLYSAANRFVDSVDRVCPPFEMSDLTEINSPRGRSKAIVGCISSFLRPGATIQVSILKDRWLSADTICLPRVEALANFLKSLCELS